MRQQISGDELQRRTYRVLQDETDHTSSDQDDEYDQHTDEELETEYGRMLDYTFTAPDAHSLTCRE